MIKNENSKLKSSLANFVDHQITHFQVHTSNKISHNYLTKSQKLGIETAIMVLSIQKQHQKATEQRHNTQNPTA